MRQTQQSVIIFIEPSENPFLTPLKIGHLFLNRFGIDEDAGFEILGIHFLHRSSRKFADQSLSHSEFLMKRDQKGRELNFTVPEHNYQFDHQDRTHQDRTTKRQHSMSVGMLIEKIIFNTEIFLPQLRTV